MRSLHLILIGFLQFVWIKSSYEIVTISPQGQVKLLEGESLEIMCTDRTLVGNGNALVIDRNQVQDDTIPGETNGAMRTFCFGPVNLSDNGTEFRCRFVLSTFSSISPSLILIVQCKLTFK